MLQTLNERLRGVIAWVIISFISLTFVLFSVDYFLQSRQAAGNVLVVNDQVLSQSTFERLYRRAEQSEAHDQSSAALKQRLLETLALKMVLTQAAKASGLQVTAEQARTMIQQLPQFQDQGQFSVSRYRSMLANAMYTPESFQKMVQQEMLLNQQRFGWVDTEFVLPTEVIAYAREWFETRDFSYLVLPRASFIQNTSVTDAQIKAYYEAHQSEWMSPQQVNISYILLSLEALKNTIHPSDAELHQYYEDNKDSFPLEERSFEKVKEKIRAQLVSEQAQSQYAKAIETLGEQSYQTPDSLEPAAGTLQLPIIESPTFSLEAGQDEITHMDKVRQAAFSAEIFTQGNNSELIQISPTRVLVLRVNKKIAPKLEPYAAVKDKIMTRLKTALATEALKQTTAQVVKGMKPAAVSALKWVDKTQVTREEELSVPLVRDMAFQLSTTHPMSSAMLPNGDAVVVHLKKVIPGDTQHLSPEKRQAIAQQLAVMLGRLDEESYIKSCIDQAKIIVEGQRINTLPADTAQ